MSLFQFIKLVHRNLREGLVLKCKTGAMLLSIVLAIFISIYECEPRQWHYVPITESLLSPIIVLL